ncbi:hypothetical protein ACJJTC_018594 [Scirpophaga incertulas]
MSSLIPLDNVVEIVKNIIDGIRCPICDKAEGSRVRYTCGHAACNDCVTIFERCILCLTPPEEIGCKKHQVDVPFSQRVKNSCNLLNVCQDTFNVNVYRRIRLSEQLKIEKELFPECIQAPVKYYNKRKSLPVIKNKENIFPGEIVTPPKKLKMLKSKHVVQEWLDNSKHFGRKAMADLNVNRQDYICKENINRSLYNRKRKISSLSKESTKKSKVHQKIRNIKNHNTQTIAQKNYELEESGIVIDHETIYIEDSQEQVLDKDRLALLAVEAAEREINKTLSLTSIQEATDFKVPFYLKGSLFNKFCCDDNTVNKNNICPSDEFKPISISIENKNFITTINISNATKGDQNSRSVCTQSDISDIVHYTENIHMNVTQNEGNAVNSMSNKRLLLDTTKSKITKHTQEKPLTINAINHLHLKEIEQRNILKSDVLRNNVIISDSDSDSLIEGSTTLQVSADIHMSCANNDSDILNELCSQKNGGRPRNNMLRISPDSNNSSDKENCDPNKRRKPKAKRNGKYDNKTLK